MKRMTIGNRISIGAGILCVLIAGIDVFSVKQMRNMNRITDSIVRDSLPGLIYAGRINANQAENQIRLWRLLNEKAPEAKKVIRDEMAVISADNSECMKKYEATIVEAEDRKNFEKLKEARTEFLKLRQTFFSLMETNKEASIDYLNSTLAVGYKAYLGAGDVLLEYNSRLATERGKELAAKVERSAYILTIIGVVAFFVSIGGSMLIVRSINKTLRGIAARIALGADETAAASTQVASASQTLAEGASEQAASLEETGASLEEMASMTRRNAENAQAAKTSANQTRVSADSGGEKIKALVRSMGEINAASEQVVKILKSIDEIAFQTNILALNAAVEAARAGSAGAGFAVVADEVRSLAQRCAQAAQDTADKIEDNVQKSRQGTIISSEVASGFNEIQSQVGNLERLVADIATASQEQSEGIAQINTAVSQMDKVTQSNAASAEESASASEELNAQAVSLKDVVAELNQLVGAKAKETAAFSMQPSKTKLLCQSKRVSGDERNGENAVTASRKQSVEQLTQTSEDFFSESAQ